MSKIPPLTLLQFILGCSGLIVTVGCADLDSPRTRSHAVGRPPGHNKEVVNLGLPLELGFGYVQGVKVGDTILVAGQLSTDDQGAVKGTRDMGTQMRQVYANIEKALGRYGAKMKDVVEEVIYHRHASRSRGGTDGQARCLF